MKKIKVVFLQARDTFKAGHRMEMEAADVDTLESDGIVQRATEYDAVQETNRLKAERKAQNEGLISKAVDRGVKRKAFKPQGDAEGCAPTVKAKFIKRLEEGNDVDVLVELLDAMPGEGDTALELQARHTRALRDADGNMLIQRGETTPQEAVTGALKCKEDMGKILGTLAKGSASKDDIVKAAAMSRESAALLKTYVMPIFNKGGDVSLRDLVRATASSDVTTPGGSTDTLSSTLILMRNLGFLKNKLGFMPYITTDLRNEPAKFAQTIDTRYITPPAVLTYVPGTGYTSDATAISNYIASLGTNLANIGNGVTGLAASVAGTKTPSSPSTTDVKVIINNHNGVEITFPTSTLGSTVRNLFAEQTGAQTYSLAEHVNKVFLATMFSATWNGAATGNTAQSLGNAFGLTGVIKLKTLYSLNKMPDMGRFLLLHTIYHDQILTDGTLLTAKAIMSLVNNDASAMESGELPPLFGIKVLESQLAAYKASLVSTRIAAMLGLVSPTDPATIGAVAPDGVGIAGNSASAVFAARIPQDYTQVFKDIPSTASMDIVTEPDSGLSLLMTKYVDHGLAAVFCRAALMFGFEQGDPRQGFIVKP